MSKVASTFLFNFNRCLLVKCVYHWYAYSGTVRMFLVGNTVNRIKLIVYRYKSDSVSWGK